MTDYARVAARVFNTPLLATPEAAAAVADVVAARIEAGLAGGALTLDAARQSLGLPARGEAMAPDDDAPYALDDGLALISVHGELVNRGSWMDAMSGLTSYKAISTALHAASADSRVRGIVLDIDSPGGEAAGAFETASLIRSVAKDKKVVAYVDSLAASAAYALASGASEIVTPISSTLGSIGVVWLHLDRSQAMKEKGVKPTILHAGAYKADGNSMAPLADDARLRIQGKIDEVYALFLSTVGRHRPKLGEEGAKATEAGVFIGQRAVEAGLADRLGDMSAVKAAFPRKTLWSLQMSDEPIHTQTALDAAVATARREGEAGATAAAAKARTDERARIKSILDGDAAKGKPKLAMHFALSTDMSPEAATEALGAAAAEGALVEASGRMARVPHIGVQPNATQRDVDPQAEADASWAEIVAKQNARLPAAARRA